MEKQIEMAKVAIKLLLPFPCMLVGGFVFCAGLSFLPGTTNENAFPAFMAGGWMAGIFSVHLNGWFEKMSQ